MTRTEVNELLDQVEIVYGGFDAAYDRNADFRQLVAGGTGATACIRLQLIASGAVKLRKVR